MAAPPSPHPGDDPSRGRGGSRFRRALGGWTGADGSRKRFESFERLVTLSLALLMATVVILATLELVIILARSALSPPLLLLDISELLDIFGLFLLVLIGLELFETMRTFHGARLHRVEVVIAVALIALGRKAVILDLEKLPGTSVLGLASLVLALAIALHIVKRKRKAVAASPDESHGAPPVAR